jgi:protein-tyrosine-phosphatase
LAGAFLAREVTMHGLPVDVLSAGVSATAGRPATAGTLRAAADLGIDLSGHESQAADARLVTGADLLIGMERLHVREVVLLDPQVWRRAFTLPDLVRRAESVGPRPPGEPLRSWLALLSAGRDHMAMMGASTDDDVRDPTTDRSVDHRDTAELIEDLVRRLVTLAWPSPTH